MNKELRETRLQEIEEQIKDVDKRISFNEKRIAACLTVSDYKACDEIKDSVIELKAKRGELKAEQKRLITYQKV